jgi:hypothetical protein
MCRAALISTGCPDIALLARGVVVIALTLPFAS